MPQQTRPRIVFFGGQGSRSLFSQAVSAQLKNSIASSSSIALLFSSCHAALLAEALTTVSIGPVPPWAALHEVFRNPETLLAVPQRYWTNSIVQGVILCLYQLLIQLQQEEDSTSADGRLALKPPAGVIGFCSGMLPAVVLATSGTVTQYIERSREAVRLAYWIGYRAAQVSREIAGEGETWATLSVNGIDQSDITELLQQFSYNNTPLHLCTRFAFASWSISGPAQLLQEFREKHLVEYESETVHVHALYHGGYQGIVILQDVLLDATSRAITFPSLNDLHQHTHIWSTYDGTCLSPESVLNTATKTNMSLLEYTLRCILVERADLYSTWSNLAGWLNDSASNHNFDLIPIGPGSRGLISRLSKDVSLPKIKICKPVWTEDRDNQEHGFAIVGMSVNFPLASNKAQFWEMLEQGLNAVEEVPNTRFNVEDYYRDAEKYRPCANPRTMPARHGNFLRDPFEFDHGFFNISPREAKSMDPQQKLLLQGAVRALDDAGYVPNMSPSFQCESMGCYIGVATQDYVQNLANEIDVYYSTGTLQAFLSGKISYAFGWSGPSIVVDTACSSSMSALALACRALENGDCSSALVGAVNAITGPGMYLGLARSHFLSPSGQCKPFDASADGYCRSEGCGVFVIKRLSTAIQENDKIYGVIRGIEMNQCGNASSITHPHSETQTALFEKIFRNTGLNPSSISVIEAHGTGTQAGDGVECLSLQNIFRSRLAAQPIFLGSIKANIGHAEAASGSAGLAKLLMMMKEKKIPPQAGFKTMNPKLAGLASRNIHIVTKSQNWVSKEHQPRRALLNNFGAAGSNAALIVEEFRPVSRPRGSRRIAYNLNISAKSEVALQKLLSSYRELLRDFSNADFEDLCYTVTARRQVYDYRMSLVCRNVGELIEKLNGPPESTLCKSSGKRPIVFVFSGQGSFYPGMGKQLLSTAPLFLEIVQRCDSLLKDLGFAETIPVLQGTFLPDGPEDNIVMSQIACFVLEYALGALWLSWNVRPDILIGHSLGEYAAMALSEAISLKDALHLVAFRAELMTKKCRVGETAMLACNRSALELTSLLQSHGLLSNLTIACENSKADSVVSGPTGEIETLSRLLTSQATRCKILTVPLGFHSAALDPILMPLGKFCKTVQFFEPKFPLGSCYHGRLMRAGELNAEYILKQVRGMVRFAELLPSLPVDDTAAFIEIGPAPTTLSMIRTHFSTAESLFLPSLKQGQDSWETLCSGLQALSLTSLPVNWQKVFDGTNACMIDCPEYPFQLEKHYVPFHEPIRGNLAPEEQPFPFHLLSEKIQSESVGHPAVFKSSLKILSSYIEGHVVGGSSLCPASVFYGMVLEAIISDSIIPDDKLLVVRDIAFENPLLLLPDQKDLPLFLTCKDVLSSEQSNVEVMSRFNFASGGQYEANRGLGHCSGLFFSCSQAKLRDRLSRKAAYIRRQTSHLAAAHVTKNVFRTKVLYNMIFNRVVTYSPKYQTIAELSVVEGELEGYGTFCLPAESLDDTGSLSPVFVDTLLHSAGFIANSSIELTEACICVKIETITVLYKNLDQKQKFSIYCSLLDCNRGTLLGEAFAMTQDGTVVASVEGMHFKKLNLKSFQAHLLRQSQLVTSPSNPTKTSSVTVPTLQRKSKHADSVESAPKLQMTADERKRTVADVVSHICQQPIDLLVRDKNFAELGFDSLMWLELSAALAAQFKDISFDSTALQQRTTVGELQDFFIDKDNGPSLSIVIKGATADKEALITMNGQEYDLSPRKLPSGFDSCNTSNEDLMTTLIQVLSEVCGISSCKLTPDLTLASLGVDSLLLIELGDLLREAFGDAYLPGVMTSENTLLDIAESLLSTPGTTQPSTPNTFATTDSAPEYKRFSRSILSRLQASDRDLPPLILFHDGSGSVEMYRRLQEIGCEVIGVGNPVSKGDSHWATSLTDMARSYAHAIIQNRIKSVVLGGWSFGGVLAHEVAEQLKSQGCFVLGVILIDSPCPRDHQPLPKPVIDYILSSITKAKSPISVETVSMMARQFSDHARLLSEYQATTCSSKERCYVMLQSEDCFESTRLCGVKYAWLEDMGARLESVSTWKEILGRQVTIIDIPGNHFEPFKPDNVSVVSAKLRQAYRLVLQSVVDSI